MKILIFGGTGMLGHRLWFNLNKAYETWVTVRGDVFQIPEAKELPRKNIIPHIDTIKEEGVKYAINSVHPDVVINCIGLIKQTSMAKNPIASITTNALLPHRMAILCKELGIRMIHFSTDCVYSGKKGMYVESDPSDADDLYGRTKYLGEVAYPNTLTLRTSIIGCELRGYLGLMEWFLRQKETIKGFKKAIYTGFTTDELSRIVLNYIISRTDLSGVYHVSSEPISKYDLLMLVKEAFGRNITILPDEEFISDRSLDSTRFTKLTGYRPRAWPEMIDEFKRNASFYDRLGGK
jgi:dTDP-4-dehydrorhamnose reductase